MQINPTDTRHTHTNRRTEVHLHVQHKETSLGNLLCHRHHRQDSTTAARTAGEQVTCVGGIEVTETSKVGPRTTNTHNQVHTYTSQHSRPCCKRYEDRQTTHQHG